MVEGTVFGLAFILALAFLISLIARLLKQPLILSYILAGIVLGPSLLNLVKPNPVFNTFSQIAVAFLLFIVGLHLNPKLLKEIGKSSLIIAFLQIIFTALLGFILFYYLNFDLISSLFIALALAFSSTIISMKLLSDKNQLETLPGRISIIILLIQDLVIIFLLAVLPILPAGISLTGEIINILLKGIGLLLLIFVFVSYLLPKVEMYLAKSEEFLFLFSLVWCFVLAVLFEYLGFNLEIGALIAGISLSGSYFHHEISSRIKPLRDFFVILFFIFLGSQIDYHLFINYWQPIIIVSFLVLIIKPVIIMALLGIFNFTKRTGFLTGVTLSQTSEFSLIFLSMAVSLGYLKGDFLGFLVVVTLIGIAGSTYFVTYGDKIYPKVANLLKIFEKKGKKIDSIKPKGKKYKIILFGYNRIGYDILKSIKKNKKAFLVIDHNPEVIIDLTKRKINCLHGDAGNIELLNQLNFKEVKMVVSTIPDLEINLLLINRIKSVNKKALIIVIAHQIDDALALYERGATYVLMPHFLGGKYMASMIESYGLNMDKFLKEKVIHLSHLKERKSLGHEHPKIERR